MSVGTNNGVNLQGENHMSDLVKVQQQQEYQGLVMHCSPAEALRRVEELQGFVSKVMVKDIDYGTIPGTKKPTLFQPGAQKLCEMYGLAADFSDIEKIEDWDKGFFYYKTRCTLTDRRTGAFVGNGIGSCNSKEDRYAWRWLAANKLPKGTDIKLLVSRVSQYGTMYRVPNDDIFSLINTIQKMAAKRALMHGVTGTTRSSGIFSQDLEDLPADVIGQVADHRSWDEPSVASSEVKPLSDVVDGKFEVHPETEQERLTRWEAGLNTAPDEATANIIVAEILKAIPNSKDSSRKNLSTLFAKRKSEGWKVEQTKEVPHDPVTGEVKE